MKRLFLVIAAFFLMVGSVQAGTVSYGWEDGGTMLGSYGSITGTNTDEVSYEGDYSLKLVDGAASGTPQAFVGWITGLKDGDEVTAGFWVRDTTPGGSPSGRIWGSYTDDDIDITSYTGSAGGSNTYSGSSEWSYLDYTWTFDSSKSSGLVIQARTYSSAGATIWIDNLTITAPDWATITVPGTPSAVPVPSAVFLLGTGLVGLAGLGRKRS